MAKPTQGASRSGRRGRRVYIALSKCRGERFFAPTPSLLKGNYRQHDSEVRFSPSYLLKQVSIGLHLWRGSA